MTDWRSDDAREPGERQTWRSLPSRAIVFRIAHVAWGLGELGALTYVWACALLRRRDRYLSTSIVLLLVQGAALAIGRGNCPFGRFQRRLGDPVPMFELALPPRAARAAMPVFFAVAVAGIAGVLTRSPTQPPPPKLRDAH